MRIFITGVAGFLGSHLADAFLAAGHRVSGVDSLIGGYADNVPDGVDWYAGDCNDWERMKKGMRGSEIVYHCAATAHEGLSVFSPYENARNGYGASAATFAAAIAAGAQRIVHCSSMARYGNGEDPPPFHEGMRPLPEDPYGIGKWASEVLLKNLAETHGIEWTVAVPHNIYGPRQKYDDFARNVIAIFTNLLLQGRQPIIYGDGSQERCFSYISDDVTALARMATDASVVGETINIGPDEEVISVYEVARLVCEAVGRPFDPVFKPARPREVKFAHCSADKARHLLDYHPVVPLRDGIARTVEWIRGRSPRGKAFSYHSLDLEILSGKVPETWAKRLF